MKREAVPSDRSISQCTIFDEWLKDLKGDGSTNVDCYIQDRTTQEARWLEEKRLAVQIEKATRIEHYMVAFTSKISHLQTTLNMLTGETLTNALNCISRVPQSENFDDPTYEEYVDNMEGVVNGFYSCLLEEYMSGVVEDGFCGPGSADNN